MEEQRPELKRCRLEYSSVRWLEQGNGQPEPEAEWESSEPHCIHNCSYPEPAGEEGHLHSNTCKVVPVLRRKEKACGLDSLDHMNWVKFSLEDSSGISKHCPEQNSPAPVPAVLTNCNTIGTRLCLSEIFESSSFWECCLLSLKCMSAVRSKPKGAKLRALLQRHSLGRGALRQHCHVWEQIF